MKYFNLTFALILLLTACSEKKAPPLKGERINVLHYDLLQDIIPTKININIPNQIENLVWPSSSADQISDLPKNIKLSQTLKYTKKISPNKFYPSLQDHAIIIVNNVVYTYSKAILSAFDLANKKNLWSLKLMSGADAKDIFGGSIIYNDGIIYVSSGNRDFIAVDSQKGSELWRFKAPNVIRHIASVKNGKIYVNSIDNTLSCLSLDGKLLWRYSAPTYSLASIHLYIPTVVYEDKAIVVTTAGDLIVLNSSNGEELTQVNLATSSIIGDGSLSKGPVVSPVLEGSNLYILNGENDLIKIDLAVPEISWKKSLPGAKSFWVAGGMIYLITNDNQLIALESKEANLAWLINLPENPKQKKQEAFFGPILAGNQLILANRNGNFFTFSPYEGKLLASYKQDLPIVQLPIIVQQKLYFIGKNGNIAIWQ